MNLYGSGNDPKAEKPAKKKITVPEIRAIKGTDRRISMVTCYDYTFAKLVDKSDIEMILVGDSLNMLMLGHSGTVGATVDDMIYHIKPVVAGAPHTFVVGDMPFGAYNSDLYRAVDNATRVFAEGGCDCLKMEGGIHTVPYIEAAAKGGIPVMGHIGLTPQAAAMLGGFKVQGKSSKAAQDLVDLAKAVEQAGACCLNLEGIPTGVAKRITEELTIPTMGIGAGVYCDSQDIVGFDMLGFHDFVPKFVKRYADCGRIIVDAYNEFHKDVMEGKFPTAEHSYNTVVEGFEV